MDDPDGIMLRFLRARKWSSSAGVAMVRRSRLAFVLQKAPVHHPLRSQLASCIKWRMGSDVEKIFEKGEEGMKGAEGFIRQMVSGPLLSAVPLRRTASLTAAITSDPCRRSARRTRRARITMAAPSATSTSPSTARTTSRPRRSRTLSSSRWRAFAACLRRQSTKSAVRPRRYKPTSALSHERAH